MIDPNRVIIGCVVSENNRKKANLETEYLFRTLNRFGGKLSQAIKWACFIEEPYPSLRNVLEELGVTIKIIKPLDDRNPYSHKTQLLDEAINEDIDYLVVLDTDIVIAEDFSSFIEGDSIKAKPVNSDIVGLENWKIIFKHFNLKFPTERITTTATNEITVPIFGSGVMIYPKKYLKMVYEPCANFIHTWNDDLDEGKFPLDVPHLRKINEQYSLALTLSKLCIKVSPLPLKMNYSTSEVSPEQNPLQLKPLIIHHHHRILDNGDVKHSPYENINKIIDNINEFLGETDSDARDSHILLGITKELHKMKNFSEIIRLLKELPEDHYESVLQFRLARAYETTKDYKKAIIRYSVALENEYHTPYRIYFNRGKCYRALGQLKDAQVDFKNALLLDHENERILMNLSKLEKQISKLNTR